MIAARRVLAVSDDDDRRTLPDMCRGKPLGARSARCSNQPGGNFGEFGRHAAAAVSFLAEPRIWIKHKGFGHVA